jgi:RimJ/RimL family protein N-acetyltransferase
MAAEMGLALLRIGFEELKLKSVIVLVDAANVRSRRVAEKLGFRFERMIVWKSAPAQLYRLENEVWTKISPRS